MKAALRRELESKVAEMLATARGAHAAAVEGATHGESRAENDKDTRGLEQSYLARGHAARVEELEAALVTVAGLTVARPGPRVALGAVVTVDDDGASARYYLAPWGGGVTLAGGIAVVTPTSNRLLIPSAVDALVAAHRAAPRSPRPGSARRRRRRTRPAAPRATAGARARSACAPSRTG